MLAQFMEYSCQSKGDVENTEKENWCSVPGCCIPFPPEPDSHAENGGVINMKEVGKLFGTQNVYAKIITVD